MQDQFTTIREEIHAEIRVRGSRFIATAGPVSQKDATLEFLARVQKQYYDATHHCYAYRLGASGNDFRFSDGGEPSGTAGRPIYSVIEGKGLTDIIVVVTRYFGGTKLGVGGLIHAYGDAAKRVIDNASLVMRYLCDILEITFPHAVTGNVMHVLSQSGARIVESAYDEDVHLTVEVRRSAVEGVHALLFEATRGNIALKSPSH